MRLNFPHVSLNQRHRFVCGIIKTKAMNQINKQELNNLAYNYIFYDKP